MSFVNCQSDTLYCDYAYWSSNVAEIKENLASNLEFIKV